MNALKNAAIRYAAVHGWHVHPLRPNAKTPATAHGLNDATNNDQQVELWWTQTPRANVGLNCGKSGLVAIDFDVLKPIFTGGDLLAQLLNEYPTVTADTGGGGVHLLYLQPTGSLLTNATGNLPTGVDVRGNGYIVLTPSIHPNGTAYKWRSGRSPGEIEIAPLPAFVLEMIEAQPAPDPVEVAAASARERAPDRGTDSTIAAFNRSHPITDLLAHHGYTVQSQTGSMARLVRPGGKSGSVVVWIADNLSYHHSTSDPLNSADHARDAFDVWTLLSHGGDKKRAYESAKRAAGDWVDSAQDIAAVVVEKMITVCDVTVDDDGDDVSPLDISPVTGLQLGWIDHYADLMEKLTASPREFHLLAGLVTAATAIQRRAWLPMSFGNIYPNVYGCIVAPSTVYGKSTSISAPRRILQSAMMENLLIPAQGTGEGLVKQLAATPSALMIRDEIGTLFSSDRVKYLRDLKQDLTGLYDCAPHSKRLSNETITVEKPYLSILGATTPTRFYGSITNDDWLDGFSPRWLYVQPTGEPDFHRVTGVFNHDAEISTLAWRLMEINKQRETAFQLQGNSFELFSAWRADALKLAWRQRDEVAMAIIGRYATYALKFSVILAALNGEWGTVTEGTMQTAMHLADHYKSTVYRIIGEREKHEITGGKLQRVFLLLQKRGGGDGLTLREVCQFLNAGKSEIEPVLSKLVERAAVMTNHVKNTKNRPVTRYYAATDKLPVGNYK